MMLFLLVCTCRYVGGDHFPLHRDTCDSRGAFQRKTLIPDLTVRESAFDVDMMIRASLACDCHGIDVRFWFGRIAPEQTKKVVTKCILKMQEMVKKIPSVDISLANFGTSVPIV